jgi:hypothetical protein
MFKFPNSLRERLRFSISLVPWLIREPPLTEAERAAVVRVCDHWIAQIDNASPHAVRG